MSDTPKPEDIQPVVVEPPKPSEEVVTAADSATEPPVTTATDEVTPVASKPAEEVTEEGEKSEGITRGQVSKIRSGPLSFFKRHRFFYFQDEPVGEESLRTYLRGGSAYPTVAAYASQTGKGLLLYSKAEGQPPHGIIKLADVIEVNFQGGPRFDLKLSTGDLHFESHDSRDWVSTIERKVSEAKTPEAKAIEDEIINSEGYKAALERYTKSAVAAAKSPEPKDRETEEIKPAEETEKAKKTDVSGEEDEAGPSEKKTDVKRSSSRKAKRASVFGFLNRRDKPEETRDNSAERKEDPQEGVPEAAEPSTATTDAPADAEVKDVEEPKPAEEAGESAGPPKPVKRHSIFGAFTRVRGEREPEEKKESEAGAKVDTEAEAKPVDAPESSTAAEKSVASSPPKSKFFPAIFEKKPKAEKEPEAKPEVKSAETTAPVPIPSTATDSGPVPAEESSAPDSTSPATSPKDHKRKSHFFPQLKRDKKVDDVKSDSEDAEQSTAPKTPSTSPVPNFVAGLIRKASKATRGTGKEIEAKDVPAPTPATVVEESTPVADTAAETEAPNGTPAATEPPVVGDVPEAVNVGQAPPVQAAA